MFLSSTMYDGLQCLVLRGKFSWLSVVTSDKYSLEPRNVYIMFCIIII